MQLLADKYAPKTLDEWLDNKQQIKELLTWITSDCDWLVISGESGCGKSELINLIASHTGSSIYTVPSNQQRTQLRLNQYIKDIKHEQGLFVLDDFELFFLVDHINLCELFDAMSSLESQMRKIIVINSSGLSKIEKYVRSVQTIIFQRPNADTVFSKCIRIMKSEGLSPQDSTLKKFIVSNQCDVRYILNALHMYEIVEGTQSTIVKTGLYDAYRNCIDVDIPLRNRLRHFEVDSGSIPIICHENYIDVPLSDFHARYISNSMALADVFHKHSFTNASDLCTDVYGCLSSIVVSLTHQKSCPSPRFGLIWTKQAAKFQKMKYLTDFTDCCHPLGSITELSVHSAYLTNCIDSKTSICKLANALSITDATHAYNLYNGFKMRTSNMTKKAFITRYNRLIHLE